MECHLVEEAMASMDTTKDIMEVPGLDNNLEAITRQLERQGITIIWLWTLEKP